MLQIEPLSALSPTIVTSVNTGGGPSLSPRSPLGGGGDGDGRGPLEHCHRKVVVTFPELVSLDPQLGELMQEAQSHSSKGNPQFCANAVWYGYAGHQGIKPRLLWLVGYERPGERNTVLHTAAAYDVAYDAIYHALPDCRDCACGGW